AATDHRQSHVPVTAEHGAHDEQRQAAVGDDETPQGLLSPRYGRLLAYFTTTGLVSSRARGWSRGCSPTRTSVSGAFRPRAAAIAARRASMSSIGAGRASAPPDRRSRITPLRVAARPPDARPRRHQHPLPGTLEPGARQALCTAGSLPPRIVK